MNKDYTMYGTVIANEQKKEKGLLICTWTNKFADGDVDYATCVDLKGNKYNTAMDNILIIEEI